MKEEKNMKFGPRKPNFKKSFKARTTGKLKRQVKRAVVPGYGKKGTGWLKNPKKAAYNKVYNQTTFNVFDCFEAIFSPAKAKMKKEAKVKKNAAVEKEQLYLDYASAYLKKVQPLSERIVGYTNKFDSDSLNKQELTEFKKQLTKIRNYFQKFEKEVPPTEHFQSSCQMLKKICGFYGEAYAGIRLFVDNPDSRINEETHQKFEKASNCVDEYKNLFNVDNSAYQVWKRTKNY